MLVGYREANPAIVQVMRAPRGEGKRAKGWKNLEHRVGDGWLQGTSWIQL